MKKYFKFVFGIITAIIFYVYFDYDLGSSIGSGIFFFWVSSLVINSVDYLVIKELFLCLFSLQFLLGPALSYNGFDEYTLLSYRMKISSDEYFLFTIPLFIAFPLGFSVYFKNINFNPNQEKIDLWLKSNKNIPYLLIIIGFVSPFFTPFIPGSLSFVSYLFESFKFVGLFILILSKQKLNHFLLLFIYGAILISSFKGGMFHDLLIWLIVLGLILALKFKPSIGIRLLAIVIFAIFASFIQSIKMGLREQTWEGGGKVSYELVESINNENISSNNGFFSKESLGPQVYRINQGWILASTMNNVPLNESHTYGSLTIKYLYTAFIPRILAPDKMKSGDQRIFNKYSGHLITDATAMGLGLFTDAYVEFGNIGSIFYIFLFGVLYGYILQKFTLVSIKYPIFILFSILAFIYPMRPDCDTSTSLNHLLKTVFLLVLLLYFFRDTLILSENKQPN